MVRLGPFQILVAAYNLICNAAFLVEHGIGYALCLERLVNTKGRNLTFIVSQKNSGIMRVAMPRKPA